MIMHDYLQTLWILCYTQIKKGVYLFCRNWRHVEERRVCTTHIYRHEKEKGNLREKFGIEGEIHPGCTVHSYMDFNTHMHRYIHFIPLFYAYGCKWNVSMAGMICNMKYLRASLLFSLSLSVCLPFSLCLAISDNSAGPMRLGSISSSLQFHNTLMNYEPSPYDIINIATNQPT